MKKILLFAVLLFGFATFANAQINAEKPIIKFKQDCNSGLGICIIIRPSRPQKPPKPMFLTELYADGYGNVEYTVSNGKIKMIFGRPAANPAGKVVLTGDWILGEMTSEELGLSNVLIKQETYTVDFTGSEFGTAYFDFESD